MSTIDNLNRFTLNPTSLDISRSRFKRPHSHKTTFMSGKLVPIYIDEVLPGDTFDMRTSCVVRMVTPIVPVMDNSFLDVYFFFVPFRLCTKHPNDWQKVCGENFDGFWATQTEENLDTTGNFTDLDSQEVEPCSLANYLGIPSISFNGKYADFLINTMPFYAYLKIWNEWFRDQNTQAPVDYNDYVGGLRYCYANDLLSVNKFHDYFTSALQSPQKGDAVSIPLVGMAPVVTSDSEIDTTGGVALKVKTRYDSHPNNVAYLGVSPTTGNVGYEKATSGFNLQDNIIPSNLYADLGSVTATDINQIRQAFAIQRMLEKDARGGTRYIEVLKSHYGVSIPDYVLQRPEYLGGKRIPLNITQVLQTGSSDGVTPLGTTGAFSNTSFSDGSFIKSFNEYGYVIGVACVRTSQSYSQGIPKFFKKLRRFDYYWPVFANLGEQPIYNYELYIKGQGSDEDRKKADEVFGYQEAWSEYRYHPNLVTGYLAPESKDTILSKWTYTNRFSTYPVLNSDFMKQSSSNIDDTIVTSDTVYQFIADFYFDLTCTRPMPLYSIPGLIDHH